MKAISFIIPFCLILTIACGEKTPDTVATRAAPVEIGKSIAEIDEGKIKNWLAEQRLDADVLPSGLHYIIESPGGSEKPTLRSLVEVNYHGTTLDGKIFDSTRDKNPIRFPLAKLISGWQEGIPMIGKGGRIKLIVPSEMAYGGQQISPEIGPNSVLVFDIELIDFEG